MRQTSGKSGFTMEQFMENAIERYIARRIKQLRADRGMTLKQTSDLTGLSKGLLSKIENCIVSPPIGTLSKLANALDVPIGEFLISTSSTRAKSSSRKRIARPCTAGALR